MNNLDLWNKVEKTNPKYTKPAKIGGLSITAIAPQYQIMLATEQFGPYGKGFGFKSIELDYSLVEVFKLVVFQSLGLMLMCLWAGLMTLNTSWK